MAVNRPHTSRRHGPPATRNTHARGGFEPAPVTGADELYGGQLVQEQVTQQQVAAGAIGRGALQFDTITETEIADDSISTPKLQANSVSTAKIQAGAVTTEKILLQDEFAATQLDATGFSGAWQDFIRTGLYNGSFNQNTAVSGASTGRTAHCPYWDLAVVGGSPVITTSVGDIRWTLPATGASARITSDRIRVSEGQPLSVTLTEVNGGTGGTGANTIRRTVELLFYSSESDNSAVTVQLDQRDILTSASGHGAADPGIYYTSSYVPGPDNKFVAVRITAAWQAATSGVPTYRVYDVTIAGHNVVKAQTDALSGSITLTTSFQYDASVELDTYDTVRPVLVIGIFRFDITASGVGQCQGALDVNSTEQAGYAILDVGSTGTGRATVAQMWVVNPSNPTGVMTSNTLKLKAKKTVNAGTATWTASDTKLLVIPL